MQDEKNFYIDFVLEGTIKVPGDEKDKVVKEMQRLFSNILKKNDSIRINYNLTAISEDEMVFPLNFVDPKDFQ